MKKAVYQVGYAVYGVGETEQAALEDAVEWIEGVSSAEDVAALLVPEHEAANGGFVLVDITDAAAKAVAEHGGDITFGDMNGALCLP